MAERLAYRDAFERRRCLILADGFYEWSELHDRMPVILAPSRRRACGCGL